MKYMHFLISIHYSCRLIRLNSPNLNYLMIIGICLVYLGAIIFAIPSTNPQVVVLFCLVSEATHHSVFTNS